MDRIKKRTTFSSLSLQPFGQNLNWNVGGGGEVYKKGPTACDLDIDVRGIGRYRREKLITVTPGDDAYNAMK